MLTICINNLNDGKYLPQLIESIRVQETDYPFEVVGIDAGSTDDSLKQYGKMCVPVVDCTGLNQAKSVNKVIRQTTGPRGLVGEFVSEFFCWINPDDSYLPNFVQSHVDAFHANPDVGIVYSNYELVYADKPFPPRLIVPPRSIEEGFVETINYICHPTTMIRRSVFDKIGLFDESIRWPFDFEFWLRAWRAGIPFHGLKEATARYVTRPDNATNKHREEIIREVIALGERYGLDTGHWTGEPE